MAWIFQILAAFVSWLPFRWATVLAVHWGWLLSRVVRLRRATVLEALAKSFPEKSPGELRALYHEMCRHQALNLMELMRFAGGKDAELGERLEAHGEEIVQAALARGKGVLILIAHFGNYDLMGLYASKLFHYPVTIITKVIKHGGVDAVWGGMRRKAGLTTVPPHNAYRACVKALRKNELVGFMLDQNRPASQGVFVDFFGRPASTSPGLAFMAAQTGAPVIPVFMHRTPEGRHVLEALSAIEPPPDRKEETILAFTARYTKAIEDAVRQYPAQWLWLHKRWKSQPVPAAPTAAKVG